MLPTWSGARINPSVKNLIKIWKWLHGGPWNHPPNYVNCETKHSRPLFDCGREFGVTQNDASRRWMASRGWNVNSSEIPMNAPELGTGRGFAFGANAASDFYACRGNWNNESYIRVVLLLCSHPSTLGTPLKIAQNEAEIKSFMSRCCCWGCFPFRPAAATFVFGVFDCREWSELHIKLNDCGNIYLFAVPELHGPLDDWVNIHHVRSWLPLITLQCCSNLVNPQKNRSDRLFAFRTLQISHRVESPAWEFRLIAR